MGKNKRRKKNQKKRKGLAQRQKIAAPITQSVITRNTGIMESVTLPAHREFVRDITGDGTALQVIEVECNPGNPSFSWLSVPAQAFESYIWLQLSFEFVPTCPTSTAGGVALCPDYDPADDNVGFTKADFLAFQDSVRGPVWSNMTCVCSPKNLKKRSQFFVSASPSSGAARRSEDALRLWVVLSGVTNGSGGELFVRYRIRLITPQRVGFAIGEGFMLNTNIYSNSQPFHDTAGVGNLATLQRTTSEIALQDDSTHNTIEFYKPNTTYNLLGKAYGSNITDVSDWDGEVNGTLAGEVAIYEGLVALASAYFTTDGDVSRQNPATVDWDGVTTSSGLVNYFRTWVEANPYGYGS